MTDKGHQALKIYKASAGSGKTFTLAVEYITLLAINPLEYQNILAVTFTNKATAEMKQRILGSLYAISHGMEGANDYVNTILRNMEKLRASHSELQATMPRPLSVEDLRTRCREALSNIIHDYSRFHIETIDSFFQSIVREIASELELSTRMKVELDETAVLSDAIDGIIEHLAESSSEFRSIVEFIEEKINSNRSWQVHDTLKEFGRNIFKENYLIHGEDVKRKMTNQDTLYQYRAIIKSYLEEQEKEVTDRGKQLLTAYEQCGMNEKEGSKSIVTFLEKVSAGNIREPKGSAEGTFSKSIAQYTESVDKWFKKTAKNRDKLQPEVERVLMPMLKDTFEQYHRYLAHAHTVAAITQHLYHLMLLNQISENVKSLNRENNRFLLSETANFLRNVINNQDIPFIYEKTGAVIKHIMIDEFQDTSVLQWGNFKPLILNSLSMGGSCLIVGDVKQSIYRFRNSDWRILNSIETDRDLQGCIDRIPAEYNFRSSGRIVTFNNDLFEKATDLLKAECPALDTAYGDVRQIARKAKNEGFVRVENIDYHDFDKENLSEIWDKQTPPTYEEATLQRIQLSVKELMDNGVSPNDITILIRTNKEVAQISNYFNTHQEVLNVRIVSDDAFRLDASPAINLIIDALRALASEGDRLHLCTTAYHYQEVLYAHKKQQLPQEVLEQIFQSETIDELDVFLPQGFRKAERNTLLFQPLSELVEDLYVLFGLQHIPHQDAYMFFFTDLLEQFCEDNPTHLDAFLQAWDEKLCMKTIPNGAADGVRMMTMHKSKGLEFHTVIIPSCSWPIKPKDTEVMWCIPQKPPYNLMPLVPVTIRKATPDSIFANDRNDEELKTLVDNINVLYVAFTRAKHNLIILTGNNIETTKEKEPSATIATAQDFLLQSLPPYMLQSDHEGIITSYQHGVIVPSHTEGKKEKEQNVLEGHYDALPSTFVSYPTVAEFRQSYDSDLFISADSPHPSIQQHAEHIRLISLGNLYHNIFQLIHTADDIPHAIQLLQSRGCFGSLLDATEAQTTIERLILDITPQHSEWFSPEWTTLNERAMLYLDEEGMLTTKRPDRVVVKGNHAIVIDYKTAQGVVRKNPDDTLSAPTENVKQIKNYAQRLGQMGYEKVEAYLWYILDGIVIST